MQKNDEMKKLLHCIRSFYGETESWVDLFEEQVGRMDGGADDENNT